LKAPVRPPAPPEPEDHALSSLIAERDPPAPPAPARRSRTGANGGQAESERGEHTLKSLGKVTDILDCFSVTARELSVTEIARRTRLPKSTAHRIIDSLRACGFLEQDATRERYRLGMKLFEYGSTVLSNMELHRVAGPFVESLTRRAGEGVHLCVFNGHHMLLVKRAMRASSSQNTLTTMEESACYSTGVGKATLAFQSDTVIRRIIEAGLVPFTEHTITDPQALRAELEAVRQRGYAIDNCEHDVDVRCVAAPIRNSNGHVFAAISVSGPARRMTPERLAALAPMVQDHAASISAQLGFC
jgi:DNA-binding IclR family transcriptional regulator